MKIEYELFAHHYILTGDKYKDTRPPMALQHFPKVATAQKNSGAFKKRYKMIQNNTKQHKWAQMPYIPGRPDYKSINDRKHTIPPFAN